MNKLKQRIEDLECEKEINSKTPGYEELKRNHDLLTTKYFEKTKSWVFRENAKIPKNGTPVVLSRTTCLWIEVRYTCRADLDRLQSTSIIILN